MTKPLAELRLDGLQIFFMRLPADRLALLDAFVPEEDFDLPKAFAEPVEEFALSRAKAVVVFILDGRSRIIRAAVGHRGYSGGYALSQILLADTARIAALKIRPFIAKVSPRFRTRLRSSVEGGGLVTPKASTALLERLAAANGKIAEVVSAAKRVFQNPLERLDKKSQFRIQQERDAGFTAMLIAGIDRERLINPEPGPINQRQWFMDRVVTVRLREDAMLTNDAQTFPGFSTIRTHVSGVVRMRQNNVLLSVFLVNRQPLEELTGSDLIYYNETFRSFVMVQYKAMEPEGDVGVFRFPNDQIDIEIARMKTIQGELDSLSAAPVAPTDFRLHNNPFFLKFCPRVLQQLTEADLVPGMYFTMDHLHLLRHGDHLKGTQGGVALRFEKAPPFTNADRYMSNSDFATLVRGGWVGTASNQSDALLRAIEGTLSSGKSVTLAVARDLNQNS